MAAPAEVRLTTLSRGAGCACKLPMAKLESLFSALGQEFQPASENLIIGALEGDDAAVLRIDDTRALVLTTDFFTPIVDNPYDWGRIAATNALSDVYAMGGKPVIAVNLTAWPGQDLPMDMLAEVLRGGAEVATSAGCFVVGGHTIDDPIPKYGMAVVGFAHPDRLFAIDRLRPGDHLILTKPIGTGVIATAVKNQGADPASVDAAIDSMTTLNAAAGEVALAAGVVAATDITGFGLLGHLHRMARASGLSATVHASAVPLLPGAREAVTAGWVPGGTRANMDYLAPFVRVDPQVPNDLSVLLHDAQTSGGLLLAVRDTSVLPALAERGMTAAAVGTVREGTAGHVSVVVGE